MIARRLGNKWDSLTLFEGFETINNPGLQSTYTTTIPGWNISINTKDGAFIEPNTTWVKEGSQSLELRGAWGKYFTSSYYIRVYRSIDVTDIAKIFIDLKTGTMTTTAENGSVYFNGVKILTINTSNVEMLNYEIDCSSLTGAKTLQFESLIGSGARERYSILMVDNIRFM